MSDALERINDTHLDVFKEIGNIGAGNAATALAGLLDKTVDMSVPEVGIVPFNEIINILDGPETLVVGVLVDMTGDLNGYILMILGMKDAYDLMSIALDEERKMPENFKESDLSELDRSVLTEMTNILVGAYLAAICTMTNLTVTPSVPVLALDMVGAIISIVAIEYGKIGDSVLFLKTKFTEVNKDIDGHFFLIPDFESYKILLESLGMSI